MNKDILQNYYDSFINQNDQRTFLIGLADYVKFVLSNNEYEEVASGIQKSKELLFNEVNKLGDIVSEEVRTSKEKYSKIKEVKMSDAGEDADRVMYSSSYSKLLEAERKMKEEKEMSVWNAWDRIYAVYLVISKKERELDNFKQWDENNFWVPGLIQDVEGVVFSELQHKLVSEKYKPYVMRVHNYLLRVSRGEIVFSKDGSITDLHKNKLDLSQSGLREVKSITIVVRIPSSDNDKIWLVFNDDYYHNIGFSTAGKQGPNSYIKTLHEIAYKGNGQVPYSSQIASSINSKIFKRKGVREIYGQKTIVKCSGRRFEINDEIDIKIISKANLKSEQMQFFPKD